MTIIFNFPNGSNFSTSMDVVPRIGEKVNLSMMHAGLVDDWANFQDLRYFTWEVDRVVWAPGKKPFVNLIMKRVMEATS